MNYGDLVRNIDTNKSGVVVAKQWNFNPITLGGMMVQVEYVDGSREIHHTRSLELNPTDELQENERINQ